MVPLGFSDHTQGPLAAAVAVAFGAVLFEKHFTLDKNLPGPDHWFSENPEGLREWTASIRRSAEMMGSAVVRPTIAERKMRVLARRSIITIRDIAKGELLTSANIGLRRPGNGLPPAMFDRVVGSRARRTLAKGELLALGDFG
jgi:sialic acid synthase SpsE